jgi:predicted transcriptional regulator
MRNSEIKDKILHEVINHKGILGATDISDKYNIPHFTIITLSKEMELEGMLTLMNIEDAGTSIIMATNKGMHFNSTSSYRKQERQKWWEEVPKKYWLVAAAFAVITFALPLYLQYYNTKSRLQNQSAPSQEKPINDSTKAKDTSHSLS